MSSLPVLSLHQPVVSGDANFKVFFIVDATASMTDCLQQIFVMVNEIAHFVTIAIPNRVFVIVLYRDYDQHTISKGSVCQVLETGDVNEIREFMKLHEEAYGGGDEEEAYRTAFDLASTMLNAGSNVDDGNIAFHFTDAPPRPDPRPRSSQDSIKDSDAEDALVKTYLINLGFTPEKARYGATLGFTVDQSDEIFDAIDAMPCVDNEESRQEQEYFLSIDKPFENSNVAESFRSNSLCMTFVQLPITEDIQTYYGAFGYVTSVNFSYNFVSSVISTFQEQVSNYPPFIGRMAFVTASLKDEEYRHMVIVELRRQISERQETGLRDLFNGKYWARIYESVLKYKKSDDRVKELVDCVSQMCQKRPDLMVLYRQSINEVQDVLDLIVNFLKETKLSTLTVVSRNMDAKVADNLVATLMNFDIKEIRKVCGSMLRSMEVKSICVPSMEDLHSFMHRATTLSRVPFIPLPDDIEGYTDSQFIELLPILFSGVTLKGLRNKCLFAIFLCEDAFLSEICRRFLTTCKGKWLDFSLSDDGRSLKSPENVQPTFMSFLLTYSEFLTEEETMTVQFLLYLSKVHGEKDKIHGILARLAPVVSQHGSCLACSAVVPVSFPSFQGVCIACIRKEAVAKKEICHDIVHNAVDSCMICGSQRNFSRKQRSKHRFGERFCRTCFELHKAKDTSRPFDIAPLSVIIETNRCLIEDMYGKEPFSVVTSILQFSAPNIKAGEFLVRVLNHPQYQEWRLVRFCDPESTELKALVLSDRRITNSRSIFRILEKLFCYAPSTSSSGAPETCGICFEILARGESMVMARGDRVCPNAKCSLVLCSSCDQDLSDLLVPGRTASTSAITCPGCRSPRLGVLSEIVEMSFTMNIILCHSCKQLKTYTPHVCGVNVDETGLLRCFDCMELASSVQSSTSLGNGVFECSCGTHLCKAETVNGMTNENCNHLECSCGNHLCGFEGCGIIYLTSEEVYSHMWNQHEGLGGRYGGHP